MWIAVLLGLSVESPVTLVIEPVGYTVAVVVRPVGEPVAIPSCRGVSWEIFDDEAGVFVPLKAEPCGPMSPMIAVNSDTEPFRYSPPRSGTQVARPVVVIGMGCMENQPVAVANCDSLEAVVGRPSTVYVPDSAGHGSAP